jgi:chemotaxis protein MotA
VDGRGERRRRDLNQPGGRCRVVRRARKSRQIRAFPAVRLNPILTNIAQFGASGGASYMFFIVGSVVVILSVLGGYLANGGHLGVLWQPFEFVIIFGAAIGAFVTSNRKPVLSQSIGAIAGLIKAERYTKTAYLELLSLLYTVFKLAKTKGALALEAHVEKPDESMLFERFPAFKADHHAVTFLCDYLRLLTLGTDNHHEMEALMDEEIETHHAEGATVASALQAMADGMPALGIVAAVLGVIHTMGSITEPPAVLGHLIGGALVGTFMGVLLSYGFVGPIASAVKGRHEAEIRYFLCIKAGILAYMQGYAPAVAVEFARKALASDVRPSFYEVEEAVEALPSGAV